MYRFLLTPRWLGITVLALLAIPFCVFMGTWQLSRFEARVAAQHHADRPAARGPAMPLSRALPTPGAAVNQDTVGRVATATGTYDRAHQFLVPGRYLDGRDGFYVLTPLRTGGSALPVVRGWLPGSASHPGPVPAAPAGRVSVTGTLQASEGVGDPGVDASGGLPGGQLGMISAASLVNLVPYRVYDGWLTVTDATAPLRPVPPSAAPNTGLDAEEFQNLGYTGEWFVFAGFVVFTWIRLARREAETVRDLALGLLPEDETDDAGGAAGAAERGDAGPDAGGAPEGGGPEGADPEGADPEGAGPEGAGGPEGVHAPEDGDSEPGEHASGEDAPGEHARGEDVPGAGAKAAVES
ncbi:SURF1 family protein [Streptantibioticus silvisoli]|uniref:SURF1-like protein n=1 Tax=Streptantibioticus silvisoli TaxID=2705255 RepID=A0ABT6VWX2_9ACTN|nr:SURF1 family protein [Streptantibioticus silvisoli]MDI5962985.1 SURF1 family protein [Streptantibioticus silvisoli]